MSVRGYFNKLKDKFKTTALSLDLSSVVKRTIYKTKILKLSKCFLILLASTIASLMFGIFLDILINITKFAHSLTEAYVYAVVTQISFYFVVISSLYFVVISYLKKIKHTDFLKKELSSLIKNADDNHFETLLTKPSSMTHLEKEICPTGSLILNILLKYELITPSYIEKCNIPYIVDEDIYLALTASSGVKDIPTSVVFGNKLLKTKHFNEFDGIFSKKLIKKLKSQYEELIASQSEDLSLNQKFYVEKIYKMLETYKNEKNNVMLEYIYVLFTHFNKKMLLDKKLEIDELSDSDVIFGELVTPLIKKVPTDTYNNYVMSLEDSEELKVIPKNTLKLSSIIDQQYVSELNEIICDTTLSLDIRDNAKKLRNQLISDQK